MKTDEFWQQVSDVIIECDDCPVSKLIPERYFCDQAGDCAGELRMLYEKLQKEERGNESHEKRIGCMNKVNAEELEQVCKPVVEYMKKNCSPHETIVITDEQFKIVADTIVIPAFQLNSDADVKERENDEDEDNRAIQEKDY